MAKFRDDICMAPPEIKTKVPTFENGSISPAPLAAPEPGTASPCALTIVVPCHNEQQVLPETAQRLIAVLDLLMANGSIVEPRLFFIDDGSTDETWPGIEALAARDPRIHGLKLSRNFGQQNAILAGLLTAPGDILISIDADLQDDVNSIEEMVRAHSTGAEVVYGIRSDRSTDGFFKRATAEGYYRLLRAMGVKLVFNHADFRLLSRRVVEHLRTFNETNLLLRGLIPQLGFRSASVYYNRQIRFAGKTSYSLSRMVSLAVTGITSFTEIPLKIITVLGILVSLFSFALAIWAFVVKLLLQIAIPGWASIVIPIYFLGGIQLLCLGVIGQYLAKIYAETKARPRFIVDKNI